MKLFLWGIIRTRILMQLVLITVFFIPISDSHAESITFLYKGTLSFVSAPLQGTFSTGDNFTGTYTFDSNSLENSFTARSSDFALFDNAVSAMSFSSGAYKISATNGNILQDEEFLRPAFDPASGPPIGDFIPDTMRIDWRYDISNVPPGEQRSSPTGLRIHPGFDPAMFPNNNGSFSIFFIGSKQGQFASFSGKISSIIVLSNTDNDLVAHWPLNEGSGTKANDVTGNGFDGVLTRGPAWQGEDLLFDGIDDYVDIGHTLISELSNQLTLTAWVYPDQLGNCRRNDCRLISKATSTAEQDHNWMLSTFKLRGKTRLRFRLNTLGSTSTLIASSGDLIDGELFHAAATYDGIAMRLYKNGIEVGALAKRGLVTIDNSGVWIGGNPDVAVTRPWKGIISDVRVYKKALTEEELQTVMDVDAKDADFDTP